MVAISMDERRLAIKFQDAIGEIVDQFLKEGMRSDLISEVLRDEAASSESRRIELMEQA